VALFNTRTQVEQILLLKLSSDELPHYGVAFTTPYNSFVPVGDFQPNYFSLTKEAQMKLYALVLTFFLATPSFAAEVAIEMLNKDANGNKMVFSQEVVKVEAGDTVTWRPSSKGHNVEMISSPNKMKFKSKNGKQAKITFETPGIYYYWCTPHKGMGMIGLVVVGNDLSNLEEVASATARGKSKKKLKSLLAGLK
jgi:pseudoazurin